MLSPIGNKSASVGQLLQFTISATDLNNDPLTFSASNLPPEAIFTPATATFSWTPTSAGTYSNVIFQVSDGALTDSESITIVVDTGDTISPEIDEINTSEVKSRSVIIQWTTDEPSTSQVEYWGSPRQLSPLDNNLVTNHTVPLTELNPGTVYRYRTLSKDKSGNLAVSIEHTFTTPRSFIVSGLTITPPEAQIGDEIIISVLLPITWTPMVHMNCC